MAREILEGFGDNVLGEWTESRPIAFHLRRRLSMDEQQRVGEAIDCRNTDEGLQRLKKVETHIPPQAMQLALEELGATR